MMRERVEELGGAVHVESALSQGHEGPGDAVIRVLIVDDHQVVREGLRFVLEQEPRYEVVGEAADGRAALEAIRDLSPDVVLLDMVMPVLDGKRVLDALRTREPGPAPAVVVLTSYPGDDEAIDAVRAGALSYLPKSAAIDRVTDAVRAAATGGSILDGVTALLVSRLREAGDNGPLAEACRHENATCWRCWRAAGPTARSPGRCRSASRP